MAREYFCAYHSLLRQMQNLSDAECGRLFRALLTYSETGELINLQGREIVAFDFAKYQIDRDKEAYDAKCSQNATNVSKRYDRIRPYTTVYDRNKEEEKEEGKEKEESSSTISDEIVCPPADAVGRVLNAWNGLNVLKPVKKLQAGTNRDTMLKARIREYGIDSVLEAVEIIPRCPFLLGENRNGWTITFDWFVKPNNFPKVLEGNYLNEDGEAKPNSKAPLVQSSAGDAEAAMVRRLNT